MKIKDLKNNEKINGIVNVDRIIDEGERDVKGEKVSFCTAEISGENGHKTRLTAWRETNVRLLKENEGKQIKLINCWSQSYETPEEIFINITLGRFGKIEPIEEIIEESKNEKIKENM